MLIIEAYRKNYVMTLQPSDLPDSRRRERGMREDGDASCLMDGQVSRLCSHKPPPHLWPSPLFLTARVVHYGRKGACWFEVEADF